MQNKITIQEAGEVLNYIFDNKEPVNESTDLSLYIKDSIDLGEFLAVVKNRHGIEVAKKELFRKYTLLGDVVKIINNEIID